MLRSFAVLVEAPRLEQTPLGLLRVDVCSTHQFPLLQWWQDPMGPLLQNVVKTPVHAVVWAE